MEQATEDDTRQTSVSDFWNMEDDADYEINFTQANERTYSTSVYIWDMEA